MSASFGGLEIRYAGRGQAGQAHIFADRHSSSSLLLAVFQRQRNARADGFNGVLRINRLTVHFDDATHRGVTPNRVCNISVRRRQSGHADNFAGTLKQFVLRMHRCT